MAQLIVVTDPDTALGFRLAGVETIEVVDAGEAANRLLSLLKSKEIGIVMYNEEYHTALPEQSRVALEESTAPVFFAVPARPAGRIGEPREECLARLLRRAIGYQLKIKR